MLRPAAGEQMPRAVRPPATAPDGTIDSMEPVGVIEIVETDEIADDLAADPTGRRWRDSGRPVPGAGRQAPRSAARTERSVGSTASDAEYGMGRRSDGGDDRPEARQRDEQRQRDEDERDEKEAREQVKGARDDGVPEPHGRESTAAGAAGPSAGGEAVPDPEAVPGSGVAPGAARKTADPAGGRKARQPASRQPAAGRGRRSGRGPNG